MFPEHKRRYKSWLPFVIVTVTGAIALAAWLFIPVLWKPYVRVPGELVHVSLPCEPNMLVIDTLTYAAAIQELRLQLVDTNAQTLLAQYTVPAQGQRDGNETSFFFNVSSEIAALMLDARSRLSQPAGWYALFVFRRVPSIDVAAVEASYSDARCRAEKLEGNDLVGRISGSRHRLMRYVLLQDRLSDTIYKGNEVVGNLALAALALMLLWTVALLSKAFATAHWLADKTINGSLPRAAKEREAAIENAFHSTHRRLAFFRVVGPAIGFLLTVSSLVAGLHPSTVGAQDTFQFVSSLHLALVATFVGLLVRIAAEFAIKLNRSAAERKLGVTP